MAADNLLGAEAILNGHDAAVAEPAFELRRRSFDVVCLGRNDRKSGLRQSGGIGGRMGPADKVRTARDPNAVLRHRGRVLGTPAEQRHVGDPREVGGEEAADHAAPDHPDAFAQGIPPARIVVSFEESMFPPEMTQTTLPAPP